MTTMIATPSERAPRASRGAVIVLLSTFGWASLAQAQAPPETVEYYATDALGSVRVVFSATGEVLGRSGYLPFGETLNQSGKLPKQRFTGQERDGEAGLDYFNARSLQARTGRMNRPDPLFSGAMTDPQGWNRYAYVRNNPLAFNDPSGAELNAADFGSFWSNGFCSAENSYGACGGNDAFWGGGGGGGGFGDATATANFFGYGGMPDWIQEGIESSDAQAHESFAGQPAIELELNHPVVSPAVVGASNLTSEQPARTPAKGAPNTTERYPGSGDSATDRYYGPDGRAVKDIDSGHKHNEAPHAHDWDWSSDRPRQPARPLGPDESFKRQTMTDWAKANRNLIMATAVVIGVGVAIWATGGAAAPVVVFVF